MIQIRLATPADIPDIQMILAHGVRSKMNKGDLAWGEAAADPGELEAIIEAGSMYIAYREQEIVGVFMLFWDDAIRWGKQPPIAAYLHRFVVASGLRGQHIGGKILELMCQEVARHGREYLRLTCPAANQQLQAYHLKNGFVRADAIARPAHTAQPMAYFERHVSGDTEQRAAKQPLRKKFRLPFTQRYE
ncbi:GNAT family N-acetyltransferase [Candidatus Saccharibacteria bacterium]|nr:GNAT family N-acetyltransferase [Candidatus Saccharibacteria bacterium]